jgi:hypothetical protein
MFMKGPVNIIQLFIGLLMQARWLRVCLLALLVCSFTVPSQTEDSEYDIKAAFIYQFTNYIDWDSLIPGDQFIIGIIGNSPVNEQLDEIARTKNVKGKKIVIRRFDKLEEIGPCHILFIPRKASFPFSDILAKIESKGTLTITEKAGYAKKGAAINFVEVDDKLKFEANPKSINDAGLKASSQLLKLAIIVN